jgi:cytosol aminopeptidase family protein
MLTASAMADLAVALGPDAGLVGATPWAHIDIAGTAQAETTTRWVPKGPTGFGARMLIELAIHFEPSKVGPRVP